MKNIQDKDLNDKKFTNLDSITVNKNPSSDNEIVNKKYIDDEIDKTTVPIFNQTLENYLKISVGKNTYNLTKIQITDTTNIKAPISRGYLLLQWNIKCNDKNNNGKIQNFIKSTKTISPLSHSGATALPPIEDAFMYIETSSNNHGKNVFVSFEKIDNIKITNITFYYNRFSILTIDSLKSRIRFSIQLLLENNT